MNKTTEFHLVNEYILGYLDITVLLMTNKLTILYKLTSQYHTFKFSKK